MGKDKETHRAADCHPHNFLMTGYKLKRVAAAKLEQRLKLDPFDMPCRLKLLGYYFKTCDTLKSDERKQLKLVLWLIRKMPEHQVLSTPQANIDKNCNPKGYEQCKKLWLQQITEYKDNVSVVTNAAKFLSSDPRLAEKLYRKAILLEPKETKWSRDLAWFLRLRARKNSPKMEKALVAMRDAVRKTKEPSSKWYLYDDLAEIAFNVSEWSIAKKAAQKCLSLSAEFEGNWNEGNAIHNANCILGRLALRKGDMTKARFHLSEAGKTRGSPQLNSFGPQMQFAQEMLRAGQRDEVINYLEDCKRFWRRRTESLSDRIAQIKKGKSPRLNRYSL